MSWQDNIKQDFTITTGDGVTYTPLWDPTRSVILVQEFNIADFDFKAIPGTLIDRGEVKGNIYDIEVCFVGADHLIHAKNFRESAADASAKTKGRLKRPWTINHPYYGILVVQPIKLRYGNDEGNVSRISGQVIETIKAESLGTGVDPFDKIAIDKLNVDAALFDTYLAKVPEPQVMDMRSMDLNVETLNTKVSPLVKLTDDYNKFKNGLNTAHSYIALATDFPGKAIAAIQAVISFPAQFNDSEMDRLLMLAEAFADFYNYLVDLPESLAVLYENNAGTVISAMCLASVTNITDDYDNTPDVIEVIEIIVDTYNQHLLNLDALQAVNGSGLHAYIPDTNSLNQLSALVNYTVSALLVIAANAKQMNIYELPDDDNAIKLAYKLYGSAADEIVDQLISDNDINYREMLVIKKGREIIYYV